MRMSKSEDRESGRKDHVGDRQHFASTDCVHCPANTWSHERRDHQRGRECREKPRARHLEVFRDAVAEDCRQIEARCPREGLCRAEHQDNSHPIALDHGWITKWLRGHTCAHSDQADINSMAIPVTATTLHGLPATAISLHAARSPVKSRRCHACYFRFSWASLLTILRCVFAGPSLTAP